MHLVSLSAAHTHTHTVPPPFLCRQPLLHWITFLGSANWSHMSGIPQTKGSYFLLHKDPYCTQQAQILGGVKEKWRGSLKPYLVSKGKLNHARICRQARKPWADCGYTLYEVKHSGILGVIIVIEGLFVWPNTWHQNVWSWHWTLCILGSPRLHFNLLKYAACLNACVKFYCRHTWFILCC